MARIDTFIPEIWAARLLHALENAEVATNFVNKDYEGEIRNMGDTVHINTLGAITVGTYTVNTPMTLSDLSTTDQTLVINQADYFNFKIEDIDNVQSRDSASLIDTAMNNAAYALVDTSDAFLFSTLTTGASNVIGTSASPVTLTASNAYDYIIDLRKLFDEDNVPTVGRKLAVNPAVYALLLKDTTHFAPVRDTDMGGVFVNGFVGRIGGFDVYETNNLVVNSTTSVGLVASHPTCATYAEQINKVEAYRPEAMFADAVKGLHLYGAKVTEGNGVGVIYASNL